jgi:voltage-gated potassium channel
LTQTSKTAINAKSIARSRYLIVLSVFAVVLETIPEIHGPNAGWFHAFDLITVGLFTLEYVLRVVSAPMLPEFANSRYPRLALCVQSLCTD